MSKTMTRLMAAALIAVAVPSFASIAAAAPTGGAFALRNAAPNSIETVRYWGRGGWGWGWGGFAAGAVIGGLLAAPYYYGGYYPYAGYYGGGPYYGGGYYAAPGYVDDGYYGGGYGYRGGYGGGAYYSGGGYYGGGGVDYCRQRYRTYDPRTGTFMGSDGRRHPCP